MDNQIWSYVLTIVGVTGFYLAGKKVWWAWYVNIACQVLWLAYALVTAQYGFLLGVLVYSVVFTKNAMVWTEAHRIQKSNEEFAQAAIVEGVTPVVEGVYYNIPNGRVYDKLMEEWAENGPVR